jgi:uncharacterized membrane protein HdeD (DUF308 family)
MDAVETRTGEMLSRGWSFLLLRGLAAIAFGILTLVRPDISLAALVLLFAAYAITDGVLALIAAMSARKDQQYWWLLLLGGLLGIGIGILTIANPGVTALALVFYIAIWAIGTGIVEIFFAIRLRQQIQGEWRLIVAGIVSVAFGAFLLARPGAGALTVLGVIAFYALFFGVLLVLLAFKARGWGQQLVGA